MKKKSVFTSLVINSISYARSVKGLKEAAVICGVLILANFSTLVLSYGLTDDYVQANTFSAGQGGIYLRKMFLSVGRPIDGLLKEALFSRVQYIRELAMIRAIGLIGLLAFVLTLFGILRKVTPLRMTEVSFLVILLATVPSLSLYVAWANYFDAPYGLILASVSAYLVKDILNRNTTRIAQIVSVSRRVGVSALLLFCSSLIHQSVAMYYWVIVACILFLNNGLISRQKLTQFLVYWVNWFLAMAASFVLMKSFATLEPAAASRGSLVSDIAGKIEWFITVVLVRSLNFNLLSESKLLAALLSAIIILGLMVYFQKGIVSKLAGLALFAIFLGLSYFPNLVVVESWASYRTLIAITSALVIFLFIALRSLLQRWTPGRQRLLFDSLLCIWAVTSVGLYSYHQIRDITFPQSVEVRFLRYRLQSLREADFNKIYLIRASWEDSLSKANYDEFGLPSTFPEWAPQHIVELLLREIDPGKSYEILVFPPRHIVEPEKGTLLIDMAEIRYLRLR